MANAMEGEYDVIVEIPKGSRVKYEYDASEGRVRVDRILSSAYVYPYNYGFIPNTLSEDGDPIDVIILGEYPFTPGCVVSCRVLGGLMTLDGGIMDVRLKNDPKIIMVPSSNIDWSQSGIQEIPEMSKMIIHDFFKNYKNNESNKAVCVGKWLSKEEAMQCINYV